MQSPIAKQTGIQSVFIVQLGHNHVVAEVDDIIAAHSRRHKKICDIVDRVAVVEEHLAYVRGFVGLSCVC